MTKGNRIVHSYHVPDPVEQEDLEVPRVSAATKAEHRRRLLDTAAEEFGAKGYAGAHIDNISVNAGFARSTVYNYFDSKDALFRAVLADFAEQSAALAADIPEDASVRSRLLVLAEADAAVISGREAFAKVAIREMLTQPVNVARELWPDRAVDPFDERLRAVLRSGQVSGQIRRDKSVEELARVLAAMANGLLIEHWLPDSPIKIEDIPHLLVGFFLQGAEISSYIDRHV